MQPPSPLPGARRRRGFWAALALVSLLYTNPVLAQDHNMGNMVMPAPTATPKAKPKVKAKAKPRPRSSPSARPMHHPMPSGSPMPMDHHMPMPSASPMPHDMPMPSGSPMEHDMPMPSGSPMEHNMPMPSSSPMLHPMPMPSGSQMDHSNMPGMGDNDMSLMMELMDGMREASGTSWQPATAPMRGWMLPVPGWSVMLHGRADVAYDKQNGPRGDRSFLSQNWLMAMAGTRLGPGTLMLRGMFSAERFTLPARGMPQIMQAGESFQGRTLIDHQHPHDLFMELAARYTYRISEQASLFGYAALAGEPALGPPAFMHRSSAGENSWAPLAHHHQDSTHISFGVATLGFFWGPLKVDGSIFNGREPDENRFNFDFGPLDSYSGRITINPLDTLSLSASYGYLKNPEALHPGEDIQRVHASALWSQPIPLGNVSLGVIWGANFDPLGRRPASHSLTFEGGATLARTVHLYSRAEFVDQEDLDPANPNGTSRVGAFTVGVVRDVYSTDTVAIGIGGDVTFASPGAVTGFYGNNPVSFQLFLRIAPPLMQHNMNNHQGSGM